MTRVVSIALALFLVIGVMLFVQYDEARVIAIGAQQTALPTERDAAVVLDSLPFAHEPSQPP